MNRKNNAPLLDYTVFNWPFNVCCKVNLKIFKDRPKFTTPTSKINMLQPIVISDFMRPPLKQHRATLGMQNLIAQNLFDWLEPALLEAFGTSPCFKIWNDEISDSIPVSKIYNILDIDPTTVGWVDLYRANPSPEVLDLLRPFFENRFVIGFELSPFQRNAFDALGVPFVSLAIHPLRFMADYAFMLSSNRIDLSAVQEFSIAREQIAFSAQLKRAEMRKKNPLNLREKSAVIFGQVEVDAALIGPRGMISLQDHIIQIADLCAQFDTVYFKPHPYGDNGASQVQILAQFDNMQFVNSNPYALLAAPQVEVVTALTSSVLTEASFFDKSRQALSSIWQDQSTEPAYGINVLSAAFWKAILAGADGVGKQEVHASARLADASIKSLLSVSWETHGAPQVSESGVEILLDTKMTFGTGQDADSMRCGSGWKVPASDHCWAGPRGAYLSFRLPPQMASVEMTAQLTLSGMASKEHPILLQILCDDEILAETVLHGGNRQTLQVPLLKRLRSALGDVLLEIRCSSGHSALFIKGLKDRRDLAVSLHDIMVASPSNALYFHVGETLRACDTSGNTRFMPSGWHNREDDGVWMNGRHSRLQATVKPVPDGDLVLILGNVLAFLTDLVPSNVLDVKIDDVIHYTHRFERGQPGDQAFGGIDIAIPLPRAAFCKPSGIVHVDLEVVSSHSPKRAGVSVDPRDLALKIEHFRFDSIIRTLAAKPQVHIANVFGPFNIHTGLAVMARNTVSAIQSAMDDPAPNMTPLPADLKGPRAVNFNNSSHIDEDSGIVRPDAQGAYVNIFSGDVTRIARIVAQDGATFLKDRYNVCYGAWELETLPTYLADTRYADEYWGLSTFIADAARKRMDVPVHAFPIPVDLHFPDVLAPRARFGIPEESFAFLFTFSVDSTMARKNPEAVLRAFQAAFPDPDVPVALVFKSMIRQASPLNRAVFEAFKAIAREDPRVVLIEETLDRDENASLYMRCDAYVSLHRAEGFGLTMAEAMGYGKPTIGTGYSGNLDFMNDGNSCLVKFDRVEMDPTLYHGQQQVWAEPDAEDAARHMRRVFEDMRFREKIARAGKRTILEDFSRRNVGRKLLERLRQIHEARA